MPKGKHPQGIEAQFQRRLTAQRARAKSLIKKVEKELEGVPQMPSMKNARMGGESMQKTLQSLGVVVSDSIRKLKGKETSGEMKDKISTLRRYLAQTKRLKDSLPPGKNSLTSPRSARDVPKLNRYE